MTRLGWRVDGREDVVIALGSCILGQKGVLGVVCLARVRGQATVAVCSSHVQVFVSSRGIRHSSGGDPDEIEDMLMV